MVLPMQIVIPIQKMFATGLEYETRYIASLQHASVVFFFQIGIIYKIFMGTIII